MQIFQQNKSKNWMKMKERQIFTSISIRNKRVSFMFKGKDYN